MYSSRIIGGSNSQKDILQIARFVAAGFQADRSGSSKSDDLRRHFRCDYPHRSACFQQGDDLPPGYYAPANDKDSHPTYIDIQGQMRHQFLLNLVDNWGIILRS